MERLLSVADMMERYQCSRQTAIRHMQKMEHMEKPYMVRASVLESWERGRTVMPPPLARLRPTVPSGRTTAAVRRRKPGERSDQFPAGSPSAVLLARFFQPPCLAA